MQYTEAKIIKLKTEDGMFVFNKEVKKGTVYKIVLKTIRLGYCYSPSKQRRYLKVVVNEFSNGFIPVECLDWPTKDLDCKLANTQLERALKAEAAEEAPQPQGGV